MTRALVAAAALAAACTAAKPIPDGQLGLAKGSVFEVLTPPAVKEEASVPGEKPALPRAFADAPPLVPHGIEDFLPLTPKANACVDCHSVKEKVKGQATPMPASHYTDYRNAPDKVGDKVAGARWVCTACHVPQTDARPLVESRFSAAR